MKTRIPESFRDTVSIMERNYAEILKKLHGIGMEFPSYPDLQGTGKPSGVAAAKAYPIQGILKYHGMTDWDWRIAYLPSISVNNDAAYSLTYVEFDPQLDQDSVIINGEPATGRSLERVQQSLNNVRKMAGIGSHAYVVSRNVVKATKMGKGLGTSASASAALATAAIAAAFGLEATRNSRFVSSMSRLLSGSGCRSAVGGIALWLSYPGISHEDSFAVRLDDQEQLRDLRLITVPLESRIGLKTEAAHRDAPQSPLFKCWMYNRCSAVIECVSAVQEGDWQVVGQLAELDSIQLHCMTMSGSRENKLFAWEPENIVLFRMCNELRSEGIPVYFSTDTGPSAVFLTHKDYEATVIERIRDTSSEFEVIEGGIGGPAGMIDIEVARKELGI